MRSGEHCFLVGVGWWRLARLHHDRGDHDRPADERERAGALVQGEPHPERTEHHLEERDQTHLGGGDQPHSHGEQREAEPDLADAERGQPADVVAGDVAGRGEGQEDRDEDDLRQARGGRHRDVVAPPRDHHHHRERQRGEEREAVAGQAALARGAEHHGHAEQRQHHRLGGAPRDRLTERHPGEQRGEHGGDGQDEQDARDARMVERGDEAAGRGRDADGHRGACGPDRPERLRHPATLDEGDVGQQRAGREHRPTKDLRRGVQRELTLEHAGGRPRDGGERHVDLPAPPALRCLECDCRRRHADK